MRRKYFKTALMVAGTMVVFAGFATPAQAADHHVSPTSSRTTPPCGESDPCRLDAALSAATLGDEILLEPGEYYESGTTPWITLPDLAEGAILRAADPVDPPVIHGELQMQAVPLLRIRAGATIRDVEMRTVALAAVPLTYAIQGQSGSLIDRSVIRITGSGASTLIACSIAGATIRNSACLAEGAGTGTGVGSSLGDGPYFSRLVNVTAISTGAAGYGIRIGQSGETTNTVNVSNSIARGPTADLATGTFTGMPPKGVAILNVAYSNWNTYAAYGNGTNQLNPGAGVQTATTGATPVFRDPANGDYRLAPGSPTIDAGLAADNLDPLAPGGATRMIGAAPDMGGYEFAPPPDVSVRAASDISGTGATLNAVVDPSGSPTRTSFEIEGPGTPLLTPTGTRIGGQEDPTAVSVRATGLIPGAAYTFRVLAESPDGGATTGERVGFTTRGPAPELAALKISKRWRLGKGTAIRIRTRNAVRVRLRFERKSGKKFRRSGAIVVKVKNGFKVRRFKARIDGRRLKPGRYRLIGVAIGSDGQRSNTKTVRFRLSR